MSNDNNTLVDSKLALSVFLDSLLKETETVEELSETTEPAVSLVTETAPLEEPLVEEPVVEIKTVPAKIVEDAASVETTIAEQAEVVIEPQPEEIEVNEAPLQEGAFQALLFKVAGLTLAVRLVELNGVLEWDEAALTEMPGHSSFYLGLFQYLGKSIPIVDTARLVFPQDKLVALSADKPLERVKRIVLIDDSNWGLACDEIAEVIELQPDEVKWRKDRSKRKWMAGTVIDHMCALVDGAGFAEMLQQGSHNRK